jgi:UDP-N-acetylglucosamine 2-epimerase (non-hydrolysing)
MEAGNRCYDFRVPEEVNRRIIDHCSAIHMPYTERSRENLLREGLPGNRIFVTGNPIKEVLDHHAAAIDRSSALEQLEVQPGGYFLVTLHRAENVDIEERLRVFVEALAELGRRHRKPVLCSLHPRTRSRMQAFGLSGDGVQFLDPLGFFDFVHLERNAFCVLTDSGTVQEETCIFHVPNVTLRDVTERPETIDCGSNVLSGCDRERILALVDLVTSAGTGWTPPREYLEPHVASTVCRIVLG